jgi:hypothetical protein
MNRSGTSRDGGCKDGLSTSARGLCAGLPGMVRGDANLFFRAETLLSCPGTLFCRYPNLDSTIPTLVSCKENLLCSIATLFSRKRTLDFRNGTLFWQKGSLVFRNRTLICRSEGLVFRKPNHGSRIPTLACGDRGFDCGKTSLGRRETGFGHGAAGFDGGAIAWRHHRRAVLRFNATLFRSSMKHRRVLDTGRSHAKCPKPGFRSTVFK